MDITGHDKRARRILLINLMSLSLFISAYILGVAIAYAMGSYNLSLIKGHETLIVIHFIVLTVTVFVPLATYLELRDTAERNLWIKSIIYLVPIASITGISDITSFFAKPYTPGYYLLRASDDAAAAYISVMTVYVLYRYLLQLHDYVSRTSRDRAGQAPERWLTRRPYALIPLLSAIMAAYVLFPSIITGTSPQLTVIRGGNPRCTAMDIYDASVGLGATLLLMILLTRLLRERGKLAAADYRVYRGLVIMASMLILFHYTDGMDMFLAPIRRVYIVRMITDVFKTLMAIGSFLMLAALSSVIPKSLPKKHPVTDTIIHVLGRGGTILVKHRVSAAAGEKWIGLARTIEEIINAARGAGNIGVFIITRPLSPILRYVENHVFSLIDDGSGETHGIRAVYAGVFKLGVSFPREITVKELEGLVFKVYEIELEAPYIGYLLDDIYRHTPKDTRLVIIIDNISDIYALLGKAKMFNLLRYILSKAKQGDILVILMTKEAQPRSVERLLEGTADAVIELSD